MGKTLVNDLDGKTVRRAYAAWAPVYDLVWGLVFERARRSTARAACAVGGRILEIGIGTGLSLEHYRGAPVELFGIDLSEKMLARAEARARSGRYKELRQLQVMDAQRLGFADRFFDCAVAQFVVTLVESPEQALRECVRVVRPGGEIILVNHLSSERGIAARLERLAAAPLHRLGLRPEFPLARLLRWADEDGRAELLECRRVGFLGSSSLVRFRRM